MTPRKPAGTASLAVDGVVVEVVRKRVKHVNLKVYPPDGRVLVSAPMRMPEGQVTEAVRGRRAGFRRHRARFAAVGVPRRLEYVSGETVNVFGMSHVLRYDVVLPGAGRRHATGSGELLDSGQGGLPELTLVVRAHAGAAQRAQALERCLRRLAKEAFAAEVRLWAQTMGVRQPSVHVRRMRSRWGTCHVRTGKVYLNLALVSRPPDCLTYVVVHELAHLIVPDHSRRFWQTVERFLPDWRQAERRLRDEPLWADPVWGSRDRLS